MVVNKLRNWDSLAIEQRETLLGYALIIPSLAIVGIIVIYPLLYSVYLSFTTVPLSITESPQWIGLEHYMTLLSNPNFWSALETTVVFTVFSSVLTTALGLATALLLNREFRGQAYVQAIVILPYVIPIVAAAFAWRWLFDPAIGLLPYLIEQVFGNVGSLTILDDQSTAIWALIIYDSWRFYPFAFLMIIARLQAIPDAMYEAADIDGAGMIAQFKDITFPELTSVLSTVFILRWIWNFNTFSDVWLLTRSVTTLPIFTYVTAFRGFERGLGAAISMLLFVFLMTFVVVYTKTVGDW